MPVTIEFEAVLLDVINTMMLTACEGDEHATNGPKRRMIGVTNFDRVAPTATGKIDLDVDCHC